MSIKNLLPNFVLALFFIAGISSCSDDEYGAGEPINERPTTLEIIEESPDHTVLEQLLIDTGLDVVLADGTYTIFAPTDAAFGNTDTSGLSQEQVTNILLNHVFEGSAESSNLETSYLKSLGVENLSGDENNLSLYINVGANVTINGISTVTGPDNLATNGVVHVVDEVITIPDVTTFATADPNFEVLVQALTRNDQPDFVGTLSSFETSAPFTVFAPTNEAFSSLLVELGLEDLADIDGEVLTTALFTHVIAENNFTSLNLPQGTVETLGANFELDGTTIIDQNGREIQIFVTDVQAGNGVVHVVDAVILQDLNLDPPPSANTVSMTVDNDGAAAYFVSEINGNENVTELDTNNSTWTLTIGTRYVLTITGASNHPFEIRNSSGDALLSQSADGSFEGDAGVEFVSSGTQFEFTLTSDLASEIDRYFCTIHSGMNGEIVVNQ